MSDRTHSRQSGEFEFHGWHGELERGATVQCCHCQATWLYTPGSGKLRGFCQNCMGFVCGPGCAECIPFMTKVELEEAGKDPNVKPIHIYVPPGLE